MLRAEVTCYTDGSSFVKDGIWGAVVTIGKAVIWTSAQRVELIALIKTLHLEKEKKISIPIAGMHLPRYMYMVPSAGRGDR